MQSAIRIVFDWIHLLFLELCRDFENSRSLVFVSDGAILESGRLHRCVNLHTLVFQYLADFLTFFIRKIES